MSYDTKAMAFSEYGPYWRHAFAPLRREEVGLLVQSLKVAAEAGEVVDLSEKVSMVLGRKNNDMFDLKGIIEEVMFLSGAFNIGDYLPFLVPLDLQGLTKRMKRISKTVDQLLKKIIQDHEQVSRTTAIVWILAELLRHPKIMKRLQKELQSVVGMDRMVEESDLPKLDYLSMPKKNGGFGASKRTETIPANFPTITAKKTGHFLQIGGLATYNLVLVHFSHPVKVKYTLKPQKCRT
ncbi:unnamed protein product [Malus baccata var. baccata]